MIFRKMHIFPDCRCADGYTLHAENSHMPYCSPPTASHDEEVSHLTRFRGISVPGGQQKETPGTLLQRNRARWKAGRDTWNAFAGIPCQVDGRKSYLEHFRRNSVPGGRRGKTPGTLLQGFRARWKAGKDTWNAFAGKPWQVDGRKSYLERFRGNSVPGGRRRRDTWYTFAGIPCQGDGRKGHLTRFRGNSVPGGRQERTPDTLSREFRARWTVGKATWNTFAGIPCQVDGRKSYLERFRRNSVPGGQRDGTPGTLLQGFRARWTAGKDTWNDKVRLEVNMRFKCAYWNIIFSYG